jgi:phage repressor protein C with HTH and peptisase S24 domain
MTQTSTTLGERLRAAVDRSGRKQSWIAEEAGIAAETLSRILNGHIAEPSFETIVSIIHATGESVGTLLGERGFALDAKERQSLAEMARFLQRALPAAATGSDDEEPNARVRGRAPEMPSDMHARGARLVCKAVGDSMIEAGILDGDLLYVRPVRGLRDAAGKVVVCSVGDATYVKQLEIKAGRIRLLSRNAAFAPIDVDDDFELIGVVVGRSGPPAL